MSDPFAVALILALFATCLILYLGLLQISNAIREAEAKE